MKVLQFIPSCEINHVPLEDRRTVTAGNVVCDLGSEALVMHQKKINLPDVVDQKFLQAIGKEMACLL